MHDRSLDSMASDSYLLKAPPASCPQYPCPSRPAKARRSTSWRVVVSLVLLLVAIMGLAALAYLQRMELLDMRNSLANIRSEFKVVSEKLESRLHSYELFRTFEADPNGGNDFDDSYEDDDDDGKTSQPDPDPVYVDTEDTNVVEGKARDPEDGARPPVPRLEPASGHEQPDDATTTTTSSLEPMGTSLLCPPRADPKGGNDFDDGYEDGDDDDERSEPDRDPVYDETEDTNVVEGRGRDPEDGARPPVARLEPASGHEQPVVRLEPASGHEQPDDATTTTTSSLEPMFMDRRRRDVRQAGRPQPQLKLYHMLQTHGLSAAAPPPEQPWGQYGARHPQDRHGYGRPQPMYAEHAPTAFVPPPQRHAAVNAAPVASRRSRVMDGVGTSPGLSQRQQHHRRRHQHRSRPQQGAFQLQNLQDVTQEVPQGGSARSVEVGRPRWQQQQQWPSPTPRPTSWSPTERAGGWRERVRAARVTDTHQR